MEGGISEFCLTVHHHSSPLENLLYPIAVVPLSLGVVGFRRGPNLLAFENLVLSCFFPRVRPTSQALDSDFRADKPRLDCRRSMCSTLRYPFHTRACGEGEKNLIFTAAISPRRQRLHSRSAPEDSENSYTLARKA